jgi:hypothetical protein
LKYDYRFGTLPPAPPKIVKPKKKAKKKPKAKKKKVVKAPKVKPEPKPPKFVSAVPDLIQIQ